MDPQLPQTPFSCPDCIYNVFDYLVVLPALILFVATLVVLVRSSTPRGALTVAAWSLLPVLSGAVGTLLGLREAFEEIANRSDPNLQDLSAGAFVALRTSLWGILLGGPLLIANLLIALKKWQPETEDD